MKINNTEYDSSREFFESTANREDFKSNNIMELMLDYATDMSNRTAAMRLNRLRREDKGIIPTTFRNTIEREGKRIQDYMEVKCADTLLENGFDMDGKLQEGIEFKPDKSEHIDEDMILTAAAELKKNRVRLSDYENPETAVNISVDDVCVKRQSEVRPKEDGDNQPKRVDNTIIHVENSGGSYILNSSTLFGTLRLLLGFLLQGYLLKKQLVFFTDGARGIHIAIKTMFGFANYKIILDWYHLAKKCREQLSMALKGSKIRNEFLDELLPCLWFGNINGAIGLLQNIEDSKVKNTAYITKLIEYFERIRGYVPCYALRDKLGLRNSSNMGEKSNDLVVSKRQKHNGMSWSVKGSGAFASVAAASRNNEIHNWLHHQGLSLKLVDKAC
jgi:hypothetical protein